MRDYYSVAEIVAYAEAPTAQPKRWIRLDEVKQHGRDSERKWVIKGTRVFDITDWIAAHPGGPVILHAVGCSIDPYWNIFTIHQKQDVYDVLEEYFIGEIDPRDLVDGKVAEHDVEDPFVNDPIRNARLLQHTQKPCNAEAPADSLESYLTPNDTFYVRNHLWVPELDEKTHTLTVELPDGTEKEYTLRDLKRNFQPFTITATLQCSGNRRKHMTAGARPAIGLQWDVGAISNAQWTGVRLRDILRDVGFPVDGCDSEEAKHVQFVAAEAYGASIPIEKALDPRGDVMLAYEMNGKTLPPDHGYPLRVLVPGNTAARSVKWIEKIILAEEESHSQWQRRDYKCFGPNQSAKDVDWSTAPAIQETPVQSAITSIRDISRSSRHGRRSLQAYGLDEDAVQVKGYAFSGGGREIVRVDVSADGGKTWQQARLLPDESKGHKAWSWKQWEFVVPKRLAGKQFAVKAVDETYNSQPESYEAQFNFRGNLTTAWHKIDYSRTSDGPSR
ncbi:Cytochrome b5-like Heme/Steroid binding domain-containing protein [Cladophialophora immunda]|nr:Cytochrome b5-like Heme/Steroid binding domain-containing protein [Cladophialophora immunda]